MFSSFSKNITYLYFNRALIQFAFGMLSGFSVLFFYQKFGESISKVLLLFIILYSIHAVVNHFTAKLIKRFGMKKLMIFSVLSLSLMFLSRMLWDYSMYISLVMYALFFTLYRAFYWIPYHIEFASFTEKKSRGKQTATLYNAGDLLAAILPFIAGILLSNYGFNILFIISFIFAILSIGPLFKVEEVVEEYTWTFKKLIKEFFAKENRSMVVSIFGNGMQNIIAAIIWPLFVFITIENDYVAFGLILTVVSVSLIILRSFVGKYIDILGRHKVLRFGNFLYFTGWILKMFVAGSTSIFVVDVYHRFGFVINKTSFDVSTYDQAADSGHFIDEYTVLREFCILMGSVFMGLILIPIIILFGLKVAFLFGAFSTLLMVSINKQTIKNH